MTDSRQKGARFERELAGFLSSEGFPARRGVQYQGGADSPDVFCQSLDRIIHFEAKHVETFSIKDLYNALAQANNEAPYPAIPCVIYKRNNYAPIATIYRKDLPTLLREMI